MQLRPLALSDEEQARQAHAELAREDFVFLLGLRPDQSWADFLERTDEVCRGVDLQGLVPATFLVAEADGEIVGRTSIRHELNDFLATFGGHIGYAVRPAYRRRGYATEILRQSLEVARTLGIDRVLVTCDVDNVGSATIIERCGGAFQDVVPGVDGAVAKRRYWVDVAGS